MKILRTKHVSLQLVIENSTVGAAVRRKEILSQFEVGCPASIWKCSKLEMRQVMCGV